ncbi:hypothetical protein EC991_009610 [Linnemannia zychae]|nr:hypothetical protein EC991_009610 [Linnemannia zychae]
MRTATDAEHRVEDEESSIFHQFIRSPSEIPWPKAADPMEGYHSNLGDPVGHSHQHSFKQPTVHDDIFSKPVVDHLVTLFFEHCFQDFDFFSPLAFLRLYAQGTVHQCLLDMICGLGARFSDHPAVAKNPNYMSGEPYVERVKAKMGQLISDVSMDTLHTFILMNFYEFSTGQHRLGYRIECLAFVMASDLRLSHFYQQASARPSFTVSSTSSSSPASSPTKMYHESEAERVAAEVKIRTLKFLLISDLYSSSVSGLTPKFNHSGSVDSNHSVMFLDLVNSVCTFAKTEYTLNKWKEYMNTERKVTDSGSSSGGGCNRPSFSASLSPIPGPSSMSTLSPGPLSNVMSSGPVSGPVSLPLPPNFDQSETFQQSGSPSVPDRFHSQYQRHMPPPIALAPPFPTHPTAANYPCAIPTYSPTTPESPVHSAIPHHSTPPPPFPPSTINPSTASTKAADTSSQWRGDQSEYARLDSEFESWKSQLSLDFNPSHGKLSLFKTDKSSRDNFSVKTGSDGRATSRSQGGARGSSTAERQQGEGSSRGGTSRQGASAGITKDGVSETKFLETSSSVGHQQYRQQLFAEEMEGVVSFSGMKRGGIMQQQQSETMTNATALTIERTPLDKCTELANEVSTMIEAFSDEMIKYRGHAFAFQVFIAATTPYWASVEHQMMVLRALISCRDRPRD